MLRVVWKVLEIWALEPVARIRKGEPDD